MAHNNIAPLESKEDTNAAEIRLDSSKPIEGELIQEVQKFVGYIERGDPVHDNVAASSHLSKLLKCKVSLEPSSGLEKANVNFLDLVNEPESLFQTKLQEKWIQSTSQIYSCVMDTHDSNFKAPIFTFADREGHDVELTNTGKPDCTSLLAPMFLEVKDVCTSYGKAKAEGAALKNHEYDVLNQAIIRVHVTAFQNELIRRIFCFASTGSRSWLVFCERSHDLSISDGSNSLFLLTETYHIIPIESHHILPTWKSITRESAQNKSYYVHSDAHFLGDILRHMQINMAYSRIKVIGNSGKYGSIVYGVSPGHPYYSAGNKQYSMSFQPKAKFAIKVHQEQNRGTNEMNVLRRLRDCQFAARYVVGIFTLSGASSSSNSALQFEDFWVARLSADGSSTLSSVSSSSVPARSPGLRLFDITVGEKVSQDVNEYTFQLDYTKETGSPQLVNDWMEEGVRMDPKDVWWEFNAPEASYHDNAIADDGRTEESKKMAVSVSGTSSAASDARPSRTAILMFAACKRGPYSYEVPNFLTAQLREMHKQNVLHTDIRISNVQPFEIDTDGNGNPIGREYIIDFDLSVIKGDSDETVEIDISGSGARRDLALDVLEYPADSPLVKKVLWDISSDFLSLAKAKDLLKKVDVRKSDEAVPKPSVSLFPFMDTIPSNPDPPEFEDSETGVKRKMEGT